MSEQLYARMIPGEVDKNKRYGHMMVIRRKTSLPDEFGMYHTWDSGDQRWAPVSKEHAEILRNHKLQPWRRGQMCPFEVETAAGIEKKAQDARAKLNASRNIPDLNNLRYLNGQGLDGQQGIPESEIEPTPDPRDIKIAQLEEKYDKLMAVLKSMAQQPKHQQASVEREVALGINNPEEQPKPEPAKSKPSFSEMIARESAKKEEGKAEAEAESNQSSDKQPEPDVKPDIKDAIADLIRVKGIGAKSARSLIDAGIMSVEALANSDHESVLEALGSAPGVTKRGSAKWIALAKLMIKSSDSAKE